MYSSQLSNVQVCLRWRELVLLVQESNSIVKKLKSTASPAQNLRRKATRSRTSLTLKCWITFNQPLRTSPLHPAPQAGNSLEELKKVRRGLLTETNQPSLSRIRRMMDEKRLTNINTGISLAIAMIIRLSRAGLNKSCSETKARPISEELRSYLT